MKKNTFFDILIKVANDNSVTDKQYGEIRKMMVSMRFKND